MSSGDGEKLARCNILASTKVVEAVGATDLLHLVVEADAKYTRGRGYGFITLAIIP